MIVLVHVCVIKSMKEILNLNFFRFLKFYEHSAACLFVCAPCACLVPADIRRCCISWDWSFLGGCYTHAALGNKPGSTAEQHVLFTAEPSFLPSNLVFIVSITAQSVVTPRFVLTLYCWETSIVHIAAEGSCLSTMWLGKFFFS